MQLLNFKLFIYFVMDLPLHNKKYWQIFFIPKIVAIWKLMSQHDSLELSIQKILVKWKVSLFQRSANSNLFVFVFY